MELSDAEVRRLSRQFVRELYAVCGEPPPASCRLTPDEALANLRFNVPRRGPGTAGDRDLGWLFRQRPAEHLPGVVAAPAEPQPAEPPLGRLGGAPVTYAGQLDYEVWAFDTTAAAEAYARGECR